MNTAHFLPAIAALALLAGCATPHTFTAPDASWKTHIGQLKYTSGQQTLIGEVVVQRRGTEDFQLEFQKAAGVPLMTIREDATAAQAEGILARGSWQGSPGKAPSQLRNWFALRQAFAAKARGDAVTSLTLDFPPEDQRFQFQFNR